MSEETTRVEVEICGERYILKGDACHENVLQAAAYVHRLMKQALARNPRLSSGKAALLTAINVAEELLRLRADYDNMVKLLEPRED